MILRFLLFFLIPLLSQNQMHSAALPMYVSCKVAQTAVTPFPIISPTPVPISINYIAAATVLSQLHINNHTSAALSADASLYPFEKKSTSLFQELLKEEKELREKNIFSNKIPCYAQSHAKKFQSSTTEDDKNKQAARAKTLHYERAQVRTEKEFLQKFAVVRENAFEAIESEVTQPIQRGDNVPITKTFFAYLGWQEKETIKAERESISQKSLVSFHRNSNAQNSNNNGSNNNNSSHCGGGTGKDPKKNKNNRSAKTNGVDLTLSFEGKEVPMHRIEDSVDSDGTIRECYRIKLSDLLPEGDIDTFGHNNTASNQNPAIDIQGYIDLIKTPDGSSESFKASSPQLEPLAKQLTKFANQARAQANLAREDQIQKFIKGHGYKTIDQITLAEQEILKNQLNKWEFECREASSIQLGIQDGAPTISFINYENKFQTIGIQPANGCVYHISQVDLPLVIATQKIPTTNTQPSIHSQQPKPTLPNTVAPTMNEPTTSIPPVQQQVTPPTPADSTSPPVKPAPLSLAEQALLASTVRKALPTTTNSPVHDADNKKHMVNPESVKNKPAHHDEILKKTHDQKRRKQLIESQDSWMERTDLNNADPKEKAMVNNLLDIIVDAQNDISVEFAQAGLQSWTKAQQAQSDVERAYYIKKSQALHEAMQYKTPTQSIAQQAFPIKEKEIDNLLQDYTVAINMYREEYSIDRKEANKKHFDRLEKRAQALTESKEQIRTSKQIEHTYELSAQARGFMMANNINYASFDGDVQVTNFQHCLTQEILDIVESSARIAENYDTKSIIGQLTTYNCNLAVAAQQLNQLARIDDAVAVIDLSHFFNAYAQVLVDSGLHAQMTMNASLGVGEGTVRAVHKWGKFLYELGTEPHQTIGKLTNDLQIIGTSLYKIAGRAAEFTPAAYLDDTTRNMLDNLARIKNREGSLSAQDQTNRITQRAQRNAQHLQDGLCGAVQTAQVVVDNMMQKSMRENVADFTETGVDAFITGKTTDCLMKLAEIVGTPILRMGEKLAESIPTHLHNSKPIFMTSPTTGELFAIADTTGESIGSAIAVKKFADDAEKVIKNAAKAKELTDKINEVTKVDKDKKEVTQFNKELAEVTNANEIKSVDRLKEISKTIPQVEEFRKYTNDFKNLEKLKPEEVLYLNLCDWVEPKTAKINARLKDCGGLKFIDPATKAEIIIEEFDLIHSLVCEMKPEAFANRTSGGHLYIPELRVATLDIGKIESFGHGFFDMSIRPVDSIKDFKLNSYFPVGTSVEQAVEMIEKAITNPKLIEVVDNIKNNALKGFKFTNHEDQVFMLLIKNKTVQFYPYKPRL